MWTRDLPEVMAIISNFKMATGQTLSSYICIKLFVNKSVLNSRPKEDKPIDIL